jgi:hypothetical protein
LRPPAPDIAALAALKNDIEDAMRRYHAHGGASSD